MRKRILRHTSNILMKNINWYFVVPRGKEN